MAVWKFTYGVKFEDCCLCFRKVYFQWPYEQTRNTNVLLQMICFVFVFSFFELLFCVCATQQFWACVCQQLQRTKGKVTGNGGGGRMSMSALKKTNKYQRSAIDLPTAEPNLECCTSDCDEYSIEYHSTSANKSSLRMQLKSGSSTTIQPRLQMTDTIKTTTNELVVISSSTSTTPSLLPDPTANGGAAAAGNEADTTMKTINDSKEKFHNIAVVSELPAIKGSKRHTWQNMKK